MLNFGRWTLNPELRAYSVPAAISGTKQNCSGTDYGRSNPSAACTYPRSSLSLQTQQRTRKTITFKLLQLGSSGGASLISFCTSQRWPCQAITCPMADGVPQMPGLGIREDNITLSRLTIRTGHKRKSRDRSCAASGTGSQVVPCSFLQC